jgi:hypothetical protein
VLTQREHTVDPDDPAWLTLDDDVVTAFPIRPLSRLSRTSA